MCACTVGSSVLGVWSMALVLWLSFYSYSDVPQDRQCRYECRGILSSRELTITCDVDGSTSGIQSIQYAVNGRNTQSGMYAVTRNIAVLIAFLLALEILL